MHPRSLIIIVLTAMASVTGCGQNTPITIADQVTLASTVCQANMVQILVGDGYMEAACGCTGTNESKGTLYSGSTPLICHLPSSSTQVYFYYIGSTLQHQIISVGANTFPSSALSVPGDNPLARLQVHVVPFYSTQSGLTFQFQDAFNGLAGQLVVP